MERTGKIKLWDDSDIAAGGNARQEHILKEVADSDILLYLVSTDSLASENCNKELTEAVRAEKRVIPIILESCDWLNDRLSDFQALPDKGNPINKWQLESDGWQNVVDGIREAVEEMQVRADTPSGTSAKELRAALAFQQGNVLMMIGQVDMAIEHYSHAIGLNPNNVSTYNNRGAAYSDKNEIDRAIDDYTQAIQLDTNCAMAYYNRGNAYRNKDDFDCAIEDFTKAIELNPDYTEAYNNRGLAHSKTGNLDRAIADYTKAIQLRPNDAEAYNNRGLAHSKTGNLDRVIEDFAKVIQLRPNDAEAYNNRGVAYYKKGEINLAIKDYNRAMNLNPDFVAKVYCNRGEAWLRLREWGKAKSDLTAARDMGADIIISFRNEYASVPDFECINGVKLPEELATMLTPQQ